MSAMSEILKCNFCDTVTESLNILKSCLPPDYQYLVCSLNSSNENFKARLRTNGKNQKDAHKWLEGFQMQSKCTMRVERTYPHSGTKNVFKVDLRCQHNTRPRSDKVREKDSCKNTDCPAKMVITIKRVVTERKSRSKDPHLPDFPTVIQIDFCHNHSILAPEILKHRSVLPEVKEKIISLYRLGHNPSTALDMHKYDLLLEHGENFEKVCHDRALLPDFQYCYRLYYKIARRQSFPLNSENVKTETPALTSPHKKLIAPLSNCENSSTLNPPPKDLCLSSVASFSPNLTSERKSKKRKLENTVIGQSEMSSQLEEALYKFCENGGFAGMQIFDNNTVMAMCTPLMHRIHTLIKQSGELVFVDVYGELDEPNSCRVFMFVTYSTIGPVPLGCVVTTSTAVPCIQAALDVWKHILPKGSFFQKEEGPDLFFTNDNDAERQSLKSSFPKSQLLICISHILQASWTFLLDRKNTIKKEHRSLFFSKIKLLLFSQSVEELDLNYAYAVNDHLIKSNIIFLDYFKNIYVHRHDWSLVYWRHLIPRANDLSIFWESAMIILKDPILSRSRTYNQLQIIDFLSRLDTYYERKLIDLANNRLDSVRLSRFLFIELPREAYTITQNSEIEYEVRNDDKDTTYQVDVSLGVCECRTGKTGAPCKHQLLVFRNFPIPVYDCIPPSTPSEKNLLLQLATGQAVEIELASAVTIPKTVQDVCAPALTMNTLDPCGEGDFFLEHAVVCDPSPSMDTAAVPPLGLSSMQSGHVLEQPSSSILSATNTVSNLLSTLDPSSPQHISVSSELNLSHHLQPSVHQPSATLPPSPVMCELQSSTVCDIIDQICSELKARASKSPTSFKPALETFLKNFCKLSSNSTLEYALYTFGKFSKLATPLFKRKIADNRLIGLQTTGEFRKKRHLKCTKVEEKQL